MPGWHSHVPMKHSAYVCYVQAHVLNPSTGPSGCGKSATLRVLASSLGFEVVEWNAPVPTLWADYQYQVGPRAAEARLTVVAELLCCSGWTTLLWSGVMCTACCCQACHCCCSTSCAKQPDGLACPNSTLLELSCGHATRQQQQFSHLC